jgi:hypothetical protein
MSKTMIFALTQEISWRLEDKSRMMTEFSDAMEGHFARREYGSAIKTFLIGMIIVEAESEPFHPVGGPRHSKKDKVFTYDLKLDFRTFLNTDMNAARRIIGTAILNSVKAFEGQQIGDFDLVRFEGDLQSFLAERGWLLSGTDICAESDGSLLADGSHLDNNEFEILTPLPEDFFWPIIKESNRMTDSDLDTERQCEFATEILSAMPEDQIIGFELTLRDLLRRANHFNVMAACKICEGHVSDDNYLYFRAGLVSFGHEVYYAAIENPDACAELLVLNTDGEYVLYIADDAFKKKFGEDSNKALPRDLAGKYFNYDLDLEEPSGEDWTEEELPRRYPRLWQAAKGRRSQPPGLKSNEH